MKHVYNNIEYIITDWNQEVNRQGFGIKLSSAPN